MKIHLLFIGFVVASTQCFATSNCTTTTISAPPSLVNSRATGMAQGGRVQPSGKAAQKINNYRKMNRHTEMQMKKIDKMLADLDQQNQNDSRGIASKKASKVRLTSN